MHDKAYGTGETGHRELPSGARAPDGGNRAPREPRTSPDVDTVDAGPGAAPGSLTGETPACSDRTNPQSP
ncbi:hypothetical protein GCM10010377_12140 [Streptomyces viridiviolaceus]|nr:hypothetical protein GCM10010377_12140 [Streptomyces viridiviolaceus]